jgi:hypothetical protein
MRDLIFPSLVSLVVPMALVSFLCDEVKGDLPALPSKSSASTSENGSSNGSNGSSLASVEGAGEEDDSLAPRGKLVFATGVGALLFVPIFKSVTGLPPYLGKS